MTFMEFLEFWPDDTPLRTKDLRELAEKHGWTAKPAPVAPSGVLRELVTIREAHRRTGISARTLRYHAKAWAELTEAGRPSPVYAVRIGTKPSSPLQVDMNELKRIKGSFGRVGDRASANVRARRRSSRGRIDARAQENIERAARRRS